MSLANFTDLKTEIANWLDRSDLGSEIPDFIKLAESCFRSRIHTRQMEKTATDVTVASTATVALPSGFAGMREVYLSTNPKQVLRNVSLDYLHTRYASNTTGRPEMYAVQGSNIVLAPTPDAVYTVNYGYYGIDSLSVSNPTNWLLTTNPEVYIAGCLHEAYKFIKNEERANYWAVQLEKHLSEVNTRDNAERYGNDLRMRPMGMNVV